MAPMLSPVEAIVSSMNGTSTCSTVMAMKGRGRPANDLAPVHSHLLIDVLFSFLLAIVSPTVYLGMNFPVTRLMRMPIASQHCRVKVPPRRWIGCLPPPLQLPRSTRIWSVSQCLRPCQWSTHTSHTLSHRAVPCSCHHWASVSGRPQCNTLVHTTLRWSSPPRHRLITIHLLCRCIMPCLRPLLNRPYRITSLRARTIQALRSPLCSTITCRLVIC